eukprot:gene2354-39533_t
MPLDADGMPRAGGWKMSFTDFCELFETRATEAPSSPRTNLMAPPGSELGKRRNAAALSFEITATPQVDDNTAIFAIDHALLYDSPAMDMDTPTI